MRRIAACIALGWMLSLALPAQAADSYRTYVNARFGFQVTYPDNVLRPRRELAHRAGRRFESRDRRVLLRVFGSSSSTDGSLAGKMRAAAADWRADGGRVTYSKLQDGWYVLSGFVGSDIFYEKTVRGDGVFATIIWEYPRAMRRRLDTPLTRSVQSFGFTGNVRRSEAPSPRRDFDTSPRRVPDNPPRRPRSSRPTRPTEPVRRPRQPGY